MPKEIQVSVSQITAHVARTICDDYCKEHIDTEK